MVWIVVTSAGGFLNWVLNLRAAHRCSTPLCLQRQPCTSFIVLSEPASSLPPFSLWLP